MLRVGDAVRGVTRIGKVGGNPARRPVSPAPDLYAEDLRQSVPLDPACGAPGNFDPLRYPKA
jgi:hypothetical protein